VGEAHLRTPPTSAQVEAAGIEPASGRFDRRCLQAYPVFPSRRPVLPPARSPAGQPLGS